MDKELYDQLHAGLDNLSDLIAVVFKFPCEPTDIDTEDGASAYLDAVRQWKTEAYKIAERKLTEARP